MKTFIITLTIIVLSSCLAEQTEQAVTIVPAVASFYKSALNKTYFINANQLFSWYEAYIDCSFRGMQLLTIENKEKLKDIVQLLHSDKCGSKTAPIWIGAIGNGRRFSWISTGKPMIISDLWLKNNPDNSNNLENCVQIYGYLELFNDRKCSEKLGYACEERTVLPTSANAESSTKYKQFISYFSSGI